MGDVIKWKLDGVLAPCMEPRDQKEKRTDNMHSVIQENNLRCQIVDNFVSGWMSSRNEAQIQHTANILYESHKAHGVAFLSDVNINCISVTY